MPLDPTMRSEKCRQVKETPHQVKEFTPDAGVGPKLVSIQERQGSIRTALKFNNIEPIDEDIEIEKLRKILLRKYAFVFKRDLGKEDRVDMDPVKINLINSSADMGYDNSGATRTFTRCSSRGAVQAIESGDSGTNASSH